MEAVHVEFMMETILEAIKLIEMTVSDWFPALFLGEEWTYDQIAQIQRRVVENKDHGLPFVSYQEKNCTFGSRNCLLNADMIVAVLSFLTSLRMFCRESKATVGLLEKP